MSTSLNKELGIFRSAEIGLAHAKQVVKYVEEHDECSKYTLTDGFDVSLGLMNGNRLRCGVCIVPSEPFEDDARLFLQINTIELF